MVQRKNISIRSLDSLRAKGAKVTHEVRQVEIKGLEEILTRLRAEAEGREDKFSELIQRIGDVSGKAEVTMDTSEIVSSIEELKTAMLESKSISYVCKVETRDSRGRLETLSFKPEVA